MCTVTWRREAGTFELLANRDIGPSRARARPPESQRLDGIESLAPVELASGGSWLGVNAFGLVLSILNDWYEEGNTPTAGSASRGLVLWGLLSAPDAPSAVQALSDCDLAEVNPFRLLAIGPAGHGLVAHWRPGRGLSSRPVDSTRGFLSSSSFRTAEVIASRRALFDRLPDSSEAHHRFHRSHLPEAGAHSVCLHRDDASTVSFSRILVTGDRIDFGYQEGSPCRPGPETRVSLARARMTERV